MKKIMHICFAFVLVMSAILLTTGIGVPKVAAEGINGLEKIEISYTNAAGTPQTSITDETTRIKMNYNFKFDNTGSEGQISEFKLPTNVFKMPDPQTDVDLVHNGQNLGTYTIKADGTVTLKFKSNLQNVNAWFWFETWINPDYTFESNKQTITLENEHTLELEAAFSSIDGKYGKLESDPSRIKWSIHVNTELKNVSNATVTDTLQQYLTFDPTTLKVHKLKVSEGGKLAYGAEVTNVQNSGSATNLSFNLGNISGAYIIEFETKIDPQAPSTTFNNTALFNGKELKATPVKYENLIPLSKANTTAQGKYGGNTTDSETTISSTNNQKWEFYVNDVALANRKYIPSGLEIEDTLSFTSGQNSWRARFVPNSMKVYRKVGDGAWVEESFATSFEWVTAPNETAAGTNNFKFVLRYKGNATQDAFKFTYETEDSAQSFYYGSSNNVIQNTVTLFTNNGTTREKSSEDKSVSYEYNRYGTKIFYKNFSALNYEKQTVTTQFVIRVPAGNTKKISIEDWSGSRLLLSEVKPENITVKKYPINSHTVFVSKGDGYQYREIREPVAGQPNDLTGPILEGTVVDPSQYYMQPLYQEDGVSLVSNKMQYHLYPKGSNTATPEGVYVIEIETPFIADLDKARTSKDLHNNAYVMEDGVTASRYASASHYFTNNPFMMKNGFKDATYDLENRKITWEVGFNYNIRSLAGAVITDTIEGNHNFDLTTFTLKKWYVDVPFEGNKAGKEYTSSTEDIAITEAEWQEFINLTETGFTLNMDDLITKKGIDPMGRYILTYETTMKDNLIDKASYKNDFVIKYVNNNPDLVDSTITGTAEVPRGGEHVEKTGSTNGRNATWRLDVNAAQSTVDSIEIVDVLSANQVLNADSIEVFEATMDTANGNVLVAGDPVTMGEGEKQYTYTIDGNTLNMTIHGVIDRPYIVTYKSFVLAANGEEINNSVYVDGKQIANLSAGTSELNKQAFALAGASATATGSVTVKKTASHTGEPLQGVVFNATFKADPQQPDMPGEQTYTVSAITDENGIATFSRLPYGEVEVYEAETIEGYILNSEPKTVTVGTQVQELAFENDPKINASVTLTKIDSFKKDLKLAGAEFKLQRKDTDGTYRDVNEKGEWLAAGAEPIIFTTSDQEPMLGTIYLGQLKLGDYQFVEVKAPAGYRFGEQPNYAFTLDANNTEETLAVENFKVCAVFEITVQKDGTPLEDGTKIVLVDKDGAKIDGTIENGKASFTDLAEGKYTIKDEAGKTTYGEVTVSYAEDCVEIVDANPTCDMFEVIVKADGEFVANEEMTIVSTTDETITFTVTTDENGKATFPKVTEGEYKVIGANDVVYDTITVDETTCEEGVVIEYTTPALVCEQFEVMVKVDGQPAANEEMTIVSTTDETITFTVTTDENGKAIFPKVTEGEYKVIGADDVVYDTITVDKTTCEEGVVIEYTTPALVCEQFEVMVKVDGQPAANEEMTIVSTTDETITFTVTTDENGKATFPNVTEGEYKVIGANDVVYDTITVDETTCQESVIVEYETPALVCEQFEVMVKVDGQPAANEEMTIVSTTDETITFTATTDENGKATFPKVTEGEYKVIGADDVVYGTITVDETTCEEGVTVEGKTPGPVCEHKFIPVPELPEGSVVIIDGEEVPGTEIPMDTQPGTYPVKDEEGKDIGEITVPEKTKENPCPEGEFIPAPPTCEKFEVTVKQGDTPLLEGTKINVVNEAGEKVPGTVNAEGKAIFTELPEGKYTVTNEDGSKTYGEFTVDYTVDCEETIVYNPTCELFEITVTVDGNTLVPGTIIVLIDENGKKTPTAVDESGVVNLPNLAEGTYTVTNVTEDIVYGTVTVDYEVGCQATVVYNTPSAPTCDQFTINVTADGTPLAEGTMIMLTSDAGSRVAQFVGTDGTVVFPNLAEGAYTVSNGDTGIVYGKVIVDYTEDCIATVTYETPPVPACTQFTVTVNADGQPLRAQTALLFFDAEGNMITSAVTNVEGSVTLPSTTLIDGTYKVQNALTGIVYGEVTVAYNEDCAAAIDYFTPAPVCEDEFIPVSELPPGSKITVDGEQVPVSKLPLTTPSGNYTVTDENGKEIGELTITPGTPENPCPSTTFTPKPPTLGSVILTKVDSADETKRLAGATFQLQQLEENDVYANVANIGVLTTDATGQISVEGLPIGEYRFVETRAPEGYVLSENSWSFVITEEQTSAFVTAKNDKAPATPGQIVITKVDASNADLRLANATFSLVNAEGLEIASATTDNTGQTTIIDVPVGSYTLIETEAPAGYVLSTKPIVVQVNESATVGIVVTNTLEEVPPINGTFELLKVDEATNTPLAGAEFTLSDGRINYKVGPTNANGFATLGDLPAGNYTLTETKAPAGYVLNTQTMDITIVSNEVTVVTVGNMKQSGEFKLTKVDAATNARLAGAVFQISNGTTTIPFETNASGEAVVTNLAAGSYIVTEISPPSGYVLNSVPKVVTIEAGKTTELTFTNAAEFVPPPVGTVEVTKIDATTKGALAGAEFTLYNDQQSYKVGPTNGSGIATVQNVQPGVYRLVEDKAPTGYVATNRETIVTVTANGTARVIVENTRAVVNGEFKIIKVDNANRALRLAGAKFELSNGVTTITLETNANGEAIARNVEAGNYTVREIVAPTGYVLDPQVTTVQIRANEMTELTATNVAQQKVGTFMLVKVDATNANKRLAGAAFELSNGVNTYTLITNATGQATVANIPAGTYTLKEVIAPAGYLLNTELVTVTIQDNSTFTFTALNSPSPSGGDIGGGEDPNTDGSGNNNGGNPNPNPGGNTGGGNNTNPGGGNTSGGGDNSNTGGGNTSGGGGSSNTGGGNTSGGGGSSNTGGGNTSGGGDNSNTGGGNTSGGGGSSSTGGGSTSGGGGSSSTGGGNTSGGGGSSSTGGGNTSGGGGSSSTGGGSTSSGGGSISSPNSSNTTGSGTTTGTVTTTRPGTTTSSTTGGTTTYYPSTTTTTKPAVTTTTLPSGTTTTTTTATLPQTNVQSTAMLTVAGALIVLIAGIVLYRRRKLS